MHHIPGLWNGLWSDMYIESTFMRYGHSHGGIIGITLRGIEFQNSSRCYQRKDDSKKVRTIQ